MLQITIPKPNNETLLKAIEALNLGVSMCIHPGTLTQSEIKWAEKLGYEIKTNGILKIIVFVRKETNANNN